MVTEGLNPIKKQCYFIPYSGKLQYQRSYMGNVHLAKRDAGIKSVVAQAIYKGDDFVYEVDTNTGKKKVVRHTQKLEDIDPDNVVGAYCVIVENDGDTTLEVMNIKQIERSWNMRKGNGLTPAHSKFADEMAKRTVINRATKLFINSSDDSELKNVNDDKDLNATTQKTVNTGKDTQTLDVEDETGAIDITPKAKEEPKVETVKEMETLDLGEAKTNDDDDAPF